MDDIEMMFLVYLTVILATVTAKPGYDINLVSSLQKQLEFGTGDELFSQFKYVFNKTYDNTADELMRLGIFKANVKVIQQHNMLYKKGSVSYDMGINQFTDLTYDEFLAFYTGSKPAMFNRNASTFIPPENVNIPDSVDWRTKNYVTGVKNQRQCGSCWAFSTTGSLEGQVARLTGKLTALSEQQLVDCSKHNHGCNGGIMDVAFDYIQTESKGLMAETDYPYTAAPGACRFSQSSKVVKGSRVTGHTDVRHADESALQNAVATAGPVSVAIHAGSTFMHYKSGIYKDAMCSSTELNHGVLAIGYGSQGADAYWLVKNSWGTSWGENGYVRMARNIGNMCGIASLASFPQVKDSV